MTFDDIQPFVRGVSITRWNYRNNCFTSAYDCRIFAIREGTAVLCTKEREYRLERGSVMFFEPAYPYWFKNANADEPFLLLTVNFDLTQNHSDKAVFIQPASVDDFDPEKLTEKCEIDGLAERIVLCDCEDLVERVCELHDEYQNRASYYQKRLSAMVCELLIQLMRRADFGNSPKERLAAYIKSYIHENFWRDINNGDIGYALGYHPYYLSRVFGEIYGISIHKYLVDCRLKNALQMLQTTEDPIETVGYNCGFSTPTRFSASFKAKYGIVPSKVRCKK